MAVGIGLSSYTALFVHYHALPLSLSLPPSLPLSLSLSLSLPPSLSPSLSLPPSSLSPPTAPSEPQDFVVSGVGAGALFANWTAPADNGGRLLSNYRVTIDSIGFSQMIAIPGMTMLLIRDSQLMENTTYT